MAIYRVFHLVPGDMWRSSEALSRVVMDATFKGEAEGAARAGLYREVAHVECENIHQVFPITNHIDHDWTTNEGVILHAERCRSTSVGDLVLAADGELHVCASSGWRQLGAEARDSFIAQLERGVPVLDPGSGQMPSP